MTYQEFIEKLNSGCIAKMRFRVANYSHYRNCELRCRTEVVTLLNDEIRSLLIEVQLTSDRSEYFSCYNHFDDRHRVFKIKRMKYTFKDIWEKIDILELVENQVDL